MQLLFQVGFLAVVVVAVVAASNVQATISLTGRTLTIGGIPYFVPPAVVSTFDLRGLSSNILDYADGTFSETALIPISVISTSEREFSNADLDGTVSSYAAQDDVWSAAFLAGAHIDFGR